MLLRMPELPEISAYNSALEPRIVGQPLKRVRLASPFLVRTVEPPAAMTPGSEVPGHLIPCHHCLVTSASVRTLVMWRSGMLSRLLSAQILSMPSM